ncbi:MAG: response regulator transcription factor [Kangiellaceae bacterium]|nr:response regulator transcription factor [Kangiellaceae bacterium]MCW8997136.1 response regulator transcription factor [Kangiellaceae bacterium]
MNEKISVMTVDDHHLVRQGIESFLGAQTDIEIIASVGTGSEAVRYASEKLPDVILMDLNLGEGINGIEATRQIKQSCPSCKIIVLTSFHSDEHIFPAIKAGALSYLLKDIHPKELYQAIQKASLGQSLLSPMVAKRIVEEMQPNYTSEPAASPLSERELQVLKLIGSGKNNYEIADELCIAIKTVRCHVSNILSKLHLRDRTQAAVHAWEKGILSRDKS